MTRTTASGPTLAAPHQTAAPDQATAAVPVPPTGAAVTEQATQLAASLLPLTAGAAPPPLPPPPISYELAPGMLVGEYRVLGRIGEGGMGAVYAAEHPLIGRKVAIKVLNAGGSSAASASQRFLQEARTASLVRHRNIVDVFAFGQLQDGRSYLVMEFLEGRTLSAYLRERGPLSFQQALPILNGICAGLKAAHDRGVVHRDLKPDNIWLCTVEDALARAPAADDTDAVDPLAIKLLDFGLAKLYAASDDVMLTRAGLAVGTPAFMSPEQCRGDRELDHRSDIYSLGVILFQLFAGRVPFSGEATIDVMNHHLRTPPPSPAAEVGMPLDLEAVIHRALAKYPEDRFDDVAELWQALRACAQAYGWAPVPRGASIDRGARGASQALPVAPDGADAGQRPALELDALRVEAVQDGSSLRLCLSGELDGPAAAEALTTYLGQLSHALTSPDEELRRVVLDLRPLAFLDPAGLGCLWEWLDFLGQLDLDPTTVRYSEAIGWQRGFISRLQHAHPTLRVEASD